MRYRTVDDEAGHRGVLLSKVAFPSALVTRNFDLPPTQ